MVTKETNYIEVEGMHCSACATRIEKVVSKIDGVSHVNINLATETGQITYDQNKTSMNEIMNKIDHIGFKAKTKLRNSDQQRQNKHQELTNLRWKFLCSALLTLPLAWAMFAHFQWMSTIYVPSILSHPLFQLSVAFPIQFLIGSQFYERAWGAIKNGSTNMDVLVVLSTTAAFFYSHYLTFTKPMSSFITEPIVLYYETSAFIITFVLLGRYLEAKTKLKTSAALEKLYHVQTRTATLFKDGTEQQVPIEQLLPGNIIVIRPGEKVPIDGQVISGHSLIDESLLTGESTLVRKDHGTSVYAGTVNQDGLLKVKVTKNSSKTVLSQIIKTVEEAQASKAPIQHIADKITGIFIPIVLMIACLTFGIWYFFIQPGTFNVALEKVIAVLIIACPCALGLATPTSILVGSGRAAQMGVLFKEGKFLELLSKTTYIFLDKTGTITSGNPQVTDMYVYQISGERFLELIGAVEQTVDHPVAKAIVNEAKTSIHSFPKVKTVQNMPGYGIKAKVNGLDVMIANLTYFEKNHLTIPPNEMKLITTLKNEGKTVMIVFIDYRYAGVFAVADEVKAASRETISQLGKMGLHVVLLTGDHEQAGRALAEHIGINYIYTDCTPTDKANVVERYKQKGNYVTMVGDGINDAPALATADIGVAIGTGSDIAIESGDVTIINGDISRLIDAMTLSKKTMLNIKQNLLWAFFYNIIMIPFAMFGVLPAWLAGAAMALSSITVVLNSLRLKRVTI